MKIAVSCPGCQASFQVDPKNAGRLGRCPHCRGSVQVPSLPPTSVTPDPTPDPAEDDLVPLVEDAPVVRPQPLQRPAKPVVAVEDDGEAYGLATEAAGQMTARVRAARAARAEEPSSPTAGPARPQAKVAVGARSPAPTQPRRKGWAKNPKEILRAFEGVIEPVRPTAAYRAWIVVVALVMLVLPLLYLALAAGLGVAIVRYAIWGADMLHREVLAPAQPHHGRSHGRGTFWAIVLYLTPIVAGVTVLAFMVKPFFARSVRDSAGRAIDPDREPLVFAFVHGVCESVGAPMPARIEVDCRVNASAHLATWALNPSKELVLTLGLPLVAGLSLRQLTGVMAHEFGHFAQGAGMRLRILIHSINLWFARVVYERDHWDARLVAWSSEGYGAWQLVGLSVRGAVWVTRRILWVFMQAGRLVSGIMARQMEFDADRYAVRMVGSTTFEAMSDEVNNLMVAWQFASNDLQTHWRERRLPDDLSRLTQLKRTEFPEGLSDRIAADARQSKAGLFDTHPSDSARIAAAHRQETDGIFHLDGPATDLFRDFDALSRAATFDHYQAILGAEVSEGQLYPVADAALNREVEREGNEAIGRFFLRAFHPVLTLPLPEAYPKAPANPKEARLRLGEVRRLMLARRPVQRTMLDRFNDLFGRTVRAEAANAAYEAGCKFPATTFELSQPTLKAARALREQTDAARDYVQSELDLYADLAAERLALALGLLELDAVADRVADGRLLRDEAHALYPCGVILAGRAVGEVARIAPTLGALMRLVELHQANKGKNDPPLVAAVLAVTAGLHSRVRGLREALGDHEYYPFEHAEAGITLARFVAPDLPAADDVGGLASVASEANDRVLDLHRRVLGRLVATAEAVERAVHLEPVEVPPDDDPAPTTGAEPS